MNKAQKIKKLIIDRIYDIKTPKQEAPKTLDKHHDYYIKEIEEIEMNGSNIEHLKLGDELSYLKRFDDGGRPYFGIYRNGILCNYASGDVKKHIIALALLTCNITTGSGKYAGRKFCNLTKWQRRVAISRAKHW